MAKAKTTDLDASMRIVVLHGKDDFQRRERLSRFMTSLEERFGEIGVFTYDGAQCALANVLDELRSYGLLQQHKLVILDNADEFLKQNPDAKGPSVERAALERYTESIVEDATLVMRARTWRPGNLDKKIKKAGGAVIKCEPPQEGTAIAWCIERCRKAHGCEIDRRAAAALVHLVGATLQRLDSELAKLADYTSGETITSDHIRTMVGLSREEKAWVIQEALLSGQPEHAVTRLHELLHDLRVDAVPIHWAVCDLLRKLHAAARMTEQGSGPSEISSALKLWGAEKDIILRLARGGDADRFAQLLQQALETDRKVKSGLANDVRSLEGLVVIVADSIGCSLRAA